MIMVVEKKERVNKKKREWEEDFRGIKGGEVRELGLIKEGGNEIMLVKRRKIDLEIGEVIRRKGKKCSR